MTANIGSITWGTDNITSVQTFAANNTPLGSIPVMRTTTLVWKDGVTSPSGGTLVSTEDQSPDGRVSASYRFSSQSRTVLTPSGGGDWTVETYHPDNTLTRETYLDGLWDKTEFRDTANAVVSWKSARKVDDSRGYDSLNRLTHVKDSRTGVTETAYISLISDQIASVKDPGNRVTSYGYDHRGRQVEVNAPDTLDSAGANLFNIRTTKHFPDGSVKEIAGGQTYRSTYTYDYAERMKTLTSYGAVLATTTWNYSATSGLLTSKKDHVNKGATYTHTDAGRLLTRTWQRASPPPTATRMAA